METQSDKPIKVVVVSEIPAYATALGVLALICAILAFLIPIIGTVIITPVAIFFGIITLWVGAKNKNLGIATFVILVVKLIINPFFWADLLVGDTSGSRFLSYFTDSFHTSYFIVLGMLIMFILLFKKNKSIRS